MLNRNVMLYAILALVLSGSAKASLNCVSQPTCETLGYVKDETCSDGSLVTCPFDTSYKKCVNETFDNTLCYQFTLDSCPEGKTCKTCQTAQGNFFMVHSDCVYEDTCSDVISSKPQNSHYVLENCTACGITQKIKKSYQCNMNYVRENTICIPCTIGSVYHADGNCTEYGSDNFYEKVIDQRIPPIGVVFQINSPLLGTAGRVVALKDLRISKAYLAGVSAWFNGNPDLTINPYNVENGPMLWGAPTQVVSNMTPNGKYITDVLASQVTSIDNALATAKRVPTAAYAARHFILPEIYDGLWNYGEFLPSLFPGEIGVWYLPSAPELMIITAFPQTLRQGSATGYVQTSIYRGRVTDTLAQLQQDRRLHEIYQNSMAYDSVIAEPLVGRYMSSTAANSSYSVVGITSAGAAEAAGSASYGISQNVNINARAVLNFDKCPRGSIYPNSSTYGPNNPEYYDITDNYGLGCM